MQKYGGRVVFAAHDEFGVIEVVQDDFERTLHFGSDAKQSSMDLSDPYRLALSYTRALLAPLLLGAAPPGRVLLLGLGGGSLAKFLLHQYPSCRVDVVELRPRVLEVCRQWFGLPEDDRLRVVLDDGADFIRRDDEGPYDLILVDAFDQHGIARTVCGSLFFSALRERLAHGGMAAINLWARDLVDVEDMLEGMQEGLGAPVARLPVAGKDNIIAIGGVRALTRRHAQALTERARELEHACSIEFSALLRILRKHNPGLL